MSDAKTSSPGFALALERVMRQVLEMKQAGDLEDLNELVWDVLRELGFEFVSCALNLMDEDRDWLTSYNIWGEQSITEYFGASPRARRMGEDLYRIVTQTSLSDAPSRYQDALAAWRHRTVEHHVLSPAEIDELARLTEQRHGRFLSPEKYPIRFYLHVPFAQGVFTLRTASPDADQFSREQVEFLQHLVEIISAGHARYREFRDMEREGAAQQVRAEVQAMQSSDDIVGVMGLLWEELHRAGIHFGYMSISVRDEEKDFVHLYGVWHSKYREQFRGVYPLLRTDIAAQADLYYGQIPRRLWDEHHTEFVGIRYISADEMEAYASRISRLWQTEIIPFERVPSAAMTALLPQGRIFVAQAQETPEDVIFTSEDLEVLETFAGALGLGFSRFFDFQRLEQRNRELEIERAVERVQIAVQGMSTTADLAPVIFLLTDQLRALGLKFDNCSISVVDRQANRVHVYGAPARGFLKRWEEIGDTGSARLTGPEILDRLEDEEGPILVEGVPGAEDRRFQYASAPLDAYHGRIQQIEETTISSRTEEEVDALIPEYAQRWGISDFPRELCPRSVLRSPFSAGTIAVTDRRRDRYSQTDARILERFADAFSMGYTRYLDFRRLEQANQALSDANNELFRLNQETQRTNEKLAAANLRIEENTRNKSEFLRRMSHDLRTPMNAIIGYTRILLRRARDKLDERQYRNLENIQVSANNLLILINEILDLSRVEAGRVEVKPEAVDLKQLAAECAASVESLVRPGVRLIQQIEDVALVRTDPDILRRVLMNLLSNAVKFTEAGSITVSVKPVGSWVELSVADTGVGIPPEDLLHIFEEFHQVERQGSPETEGTGLGLAIARRSVELLGGTITAESEVGKGTIFAMKIGNFES